jgi:DNA-binding transcriptional ArsR family regulator
VEGGRNPGWYDVSVPANIEPTEPLGLAHRKDSKLASLDEQVLEKQVRICKAFANATRLQMLDLLGQREWPASELQEQLSISKPNLSQHLAVLKGAGVVSTRREGKQVYCSLAFPEVKSACRLIRDVLRAQIQQGRRLIV